MDRSAPIRNSEASSGRSWGGPYERSDTDYGSELGTALFLSAEENLSRGGAQPLGESSLR